jgi:plasmid stabilization system protein ParE
MEFLAPNGSEGVLEAVALLAAAFASLSELSERGRPSVTQPGLRELVVPFRRAAYIIQYRVEPTRVVIVRVFHSLEDRR